MLLDICSVDGHLILWQIPLPSNGWERQFYECLSTNLQSTPNLTKPMHQDWYYIWNMRVFIIHTTGHLRHIRLCDVVRFLAEIIHCSGG
jgi:hypothetical protein